MEGSTDVIVRYGGNFTTFGYWVGGRRRTDSLSWEYMGVSCLDVHLSFLPGYNKPSAWGRRQLFSWVSNNLPIEMYPQVWTHPKSSIIRQCPRPSQWLLQHLILDLLKLILHGSSGSTKNWENPLEKTVLDLFAISTSQFVRLSPQHIGGRNSLRWPGRWSRIASSGSPQTWPLRMVHLKWPLEYGFVWK